MKIETALLETKIIILGIVVLAGWSLWYFYFYLINSGSLN